MFDITSGKLLILAIVALLVVGPKDLPILLRTIGKYMGVIRRHAAEFRAQFEEAVRETELEQLKKDVESVGHEMKSVLHEGAAEVDKQLETAQRDVDQSLESAPSGADSKAQSNTLPPAQPQPAKETDLPEKTGT